MKGYKPSIAFAVFFALARVFATLLRSG